MDWGAVFVVLAMLVFAAAYVALPVLQRQGAVVTEAARERSALLARREQVLDTLAELEFDYSVGKVAEAHYLQRRQTLLREGAAILQRLDVLDTRHHAARAPVVATSRRRARRPTGSMDTLPEDPLETLLASRRRQREAKTAGFCSQCGAPVLEGDRFCPRCGSPLTT